MPVHAIITILWSAFVALNAKQVVFTVPYCVFFLVVVVVLSGDMARQLVLVALVAMVVVVVGLHSSLQHGLVHAFPHGFECGTGHSHVHADADIAKVSQSYHTAEHEQVQEAERRRLQDQVYHLGANSQFLPLSIAKQSNLAGPIRIKVLWDVVEGGDYTGSRSGSNARQCTAVGTSRPKLSRDCWFSGLSETPSQLTTLLHIRLPRPNHPCRLPELAVAVPGALGERLPS